METFPGQIYLEQQPRMINLTDGHVCTMTARLSVFVHVAQLAAVAGVGADEHCDCVSVLLMQ